MKKIIFLFSLLCICHFSFCIEFDQAACADLSAKIFYINTHQAVLYVSANHYNQKGMGFDKFEVRNSFRKDQQTINLTLEMAKGGTPHLRLAIPLQMDKKIPQVFLLSTRKLGWMKKINKEWAWNAEKTRQGVLVFKSYIDSDCKKILNILKLNLADNKAELSSHPRKKFQVSWKGNNLILHELSSFRGRDTFFMNSYFRKIEGNKILPSGEYYTADSCITVLEYTVDYWCGLRIFPIIEKFYLTGIE